MQLIAECSKPGRWDLGSSAWVGRLCLGERRLLIRKPGDPSLGHWHFAMHHWQDSTVLCWPARPDFCGGQLVFELGVEAGGRVLVSIFEAETVEALSFLWHSLARQVAMYLRPLDFGSWVEGVCRRRGSSVQICRSAACVLVVGAQLRARARDILWRRGA